MKKGKPSVISTRYAIAERDCDGLYTVRNKIKEEICATRVTLDQARAWIRHIQISYSAGAVKTSAKEKHQIILDAVEVAVRDPHIVEYLRRNDPKALLQLDNAAVLLRLTSRVH